MPKSHIKIDADLGPAVTALKGMESLHAAFNQPTHLSSLTRSAFDVMEGNFYMDTALLAKGQPENFHHVYEPEHIGEPPFQLFKAKMTGSAGRRKISWDWRASVLTVPTETGPTGKDRWAGAGDKFDPSKLNRVHVFVWKAPVMEYGVTVTVRPKLSSWLVFPAGEVQGSGGATPVFTQHSYTFTPGKLVHGNFTSWFIKWWGDGMGEQSLNKWERDRDVAFRKSFEERLAYITRPRGTSGNAAAVNSKAAIDGKRMARLVAGDVQRKYEEMARKRKKVTSPDEE